MRGSVVVGDSSIDNIIRLITIAASRGRVSAVVCIVIWCSKISTRSAELVAHKYPVPLSHQQVKNPENCFGILRQLRTTALCVAVCLVSCRGFGSDKAWLWKRYAGRHCIVSTGPPAGCHECSGSTCLPDKSLWLYHSATPPPALASCAATHILQASLHGLPVRPWTLTPFSLSTGFPVDNACGHRRPRHWTQLTTVHCRRPSVSRRRGTNMEQFASWSDVVKFPANLQNQTKSHLFLASFHSLKTVTVFVKYLKCLGIFYFKCNVM